MTAARPTIYLHIGAMKTGTTFLQKLMFANQDNLRAAGCLVAGESTHEQALAAHRYFVRSGRDWSPWSCKPWRWE